MKIPPYEIRQDPRASAAPKATSDFQSWSVRRDSYALTVYGNYYKQEAFINVSLNATVAIFDLEEKPICTVTMTSHPLETIGYLKDRMRGSDWEQFDAIETDLEEIRRQIVEWLQATYSYTGPV